ncbi:BTB/POZ domain-containing protein 6-B isoform X1 [Cloeon dipterum]|uniref:BTB/POZ domain-containing protein 6-B isoform X1 n=1 Tax=Cloeon dipterum TaxID=197152 RepID=UPI00321FF88D
MLSTAGSAIVDSFKPESAVQVVGEASLAAVAALGPASAPGAAGPRHLVRWLCQQADLWLLLYQVIVRVQEPIERSAEHVEQLLLQLGPLDPEEPAPATSDECQNREVPPPEPPPQPPPQHAARFAFPWWTQSAAESIESSSGGVGGGISQRESNILVTQPASLPNSPLASPNSLTTTFNLSPPVSPPPPTHSTDDPNWQACKPSVRERNAAMFNNELMADVHFLVGSPVQSIPAHKYVLATGSSVFYAMFFGGLAEESAEIEVPDVEPQAFLTMLRYLYCDEIQLEADTVLATLYVAKKYMVPHLAKACVSYLETSLTAKNACLLLSQSRLFEEPELMQRCWEVIDAQAEMALHSEGFVDIDLNTLESVLSRETLNCKETALFEAAISWARAECQRREIDPTAQNVRGVLGKALFLVRIPTMALDEFANKAAQSGVLTLKETIDIFLHFTADIKPTLSYPTKARTGLKPQLCHRFQSCAYRNNQWRYRGRCDSIQFSVDKRIFVVGFGLYGSSNGAADYNVKIELKRLGRILAENETQFFSDGSSNTFHVYFKHPIQIEPEAFYMASAVLDGQELSYFGQEGMSEVSVGTVTFQFQCSSESTNGTGVQGGQIPELIFYGPQPVLSDEH